MSTSLSIFQEKAIRKVWHKDEWWFVITDVIFALTDSIDPQGYIRDIRRRDAEISKGWGQIATPLFADTAGGRQKVACANTEGIFRIIQSIPSPKAEPFKLWLAKVGYDRVKEIENPELGMERTRELYQMKGYPADWIEIRMRGKEIRDSLTDEWKKRQVKEGREYQILTAEIAKATFGVTPSQHKTLKKIRRGNLRDHMTSLELIFSMLGEASTTEIAREKDAQGFAQNRSAAQKGGKIAGDARKKLELESGKKVVSKRNALRQSEKAPELTE